jgi:hypothetical protein
MFECADGQFLQFHTGGPGGFKAAMDVLGFGDRVQAVQGAEMRVPLSEDEYRIARVEVFEAFKGNRATNGSACCTPPMWPRCRCCTRPRCCWTIRWNSWASALPCPMPISARSTSRRPR